MQAYICAVVVRDKRTNIVLSVSPMDIESDVYPSVFYPAELMTLEEIENVFITDLVWSRDDWEFEYRIKEFKERQGFHLREGAISIGNVQVELEYKYVEWE